MLKLSKKKTREIIDIIANQCYNIIVKRHIAAVKCESYEGHISALNETVRSECFATLSASLNRRYGARVTPQKEIPIEDMVRG